MIQPKFLLQRKLRLEVLELDLRDTPANLVMNTATLVDASNTVMSNPVYGQMVFIRANWQANSMSGSEPAVTVRYTANFGTNYFYSGSPAKAFPADSGAVTHSAGNTFWNWYRGGWYAGIGSFTVTATIDPDNLIAETNESDNTVTFTINPVAPTDLPNKFLQPIGLTPNKDWSISNYADIDPEANVRFDYRLGTRQYDGHDAIDAGPVGFADQDEGVPITAVADGVIDQIDGGTNFDRETSWNGGQNWNAVWVNHGNGWRTVYGHLAAGSITVKVGDTVKAGQLLGLMGSAGISTGTHTHYTAYYRGCEVEAGFSPSSYWINPLPYADDVPSYYRDAGISVYSPFTYSGEYQEKVSQYTSVGTTDPGSTNLYFYIDGYNLKTTDVMYWRWIRPDGSTENTSNFSPNNNYAYSQWWWTRSVSSFQGSVGTWQIVWYLNGTSPANEQRRQSFQVVSGAGAGSIRMIRSSDSSHIIDGRTTPIDFGTIAQGGGAPQQSFTIFNHGVGALTLSNFVLPTGFSIVSSPSSISGGASGTLTIRLDTSVVGSKFGSVRFDTNDPDVGTFEFNVSGTVSGTPPTGSPVISVSGNSATTYNYQSLPRPISPAATLSDSNSSNFSGGTLTVGYASFGAPEDQLGIRNQGTGAGLIGVSGNVVSYAGTPIGTYSGGSGLTPLVVTLNANSTISATQALLRNITYQNTSATPVTQRKAVRLTLTDGTGNTSNLEIQHVINSGFSRNPTINAISSPSVVRGATLNQGGSFTDPYGSSWTATVDYGDGSGIQALTLNGDKTFTLNHQYTALPGSYSITITVNNELGGTKTLVVPLTVLTNALVTSVIVPANGTYGIGQTMDFTVRYAVPVNVVTTGGTPTLQFTLNTGGTVAASYVSGSGTTDLLFRFTVASGQTDPDGIAVLSPLLTNGGTIKDLAGNDADLTLTGIQSTTNVLVGNPPTNITVTPSTVLENQPSGTVVGTLSSTDVNAGDTFTYALVNGTGATDNALFMISGSTLKTASAFDFETKNSYSIRVQSTDSSGLKFEKVLTVSVTNANENPTDLTLSNLSVTENLATGTLVGNVNTLDPDASDTFTYQLVNGTGSTNNSSFSLSSSGVLTTSEVFDFETKNSYSIRVKTTDAGGLSTEKAFTININNANDPPTNLLLSSSSVNENLSIGSNVGTFSTTDQDTVDSYTYSLVSGTGSTNNNSFSLSTTGILTTNAVFDFETQNSYSIRVKTLDAGGQSFEKVFVISINDTNDSPQNITLNSSTVAENAVSGTLVGTFASIDQDTGDTFNYSLVSGIGSADNSSFTVTPSGQLNTASSFNFESKNTYSIRVRSTDSRGGLFEKSFNISVTDVNEAPSFVNEPIKLYFQNDYTNNTIIGKVSAIDPDAGDTKLFEIVSGDPLGLFSIHPSTGDVSIINVAAATTNYSIQVKVTDSQGLTDLTTVSIQRDSRPIVTTPIPDQNSLEDAAPIQLDLKSYFSDAETIPANLQFQVISNSATSLVSTSISGSTLTLAPQANQFGDSTIIVQTVDEAGLKVTDSFVVHLDPVNDQPTLTDIPKPAAILEDAIEQTITLAGVTAGTPNEADQQLSVTAVSSNGNLISSVSVLQNAGVWSLKYTPIADANGSATITVTVTDNGGTVNNGINTIQKTFVVDVTPVADRPKLDPELGVLVEVIEPKATLFAGAPVSFLTAHVTDPDQDASNGIAITGLPDTILNGQWQYSVNKGVTWTSIFDVSDTNALLLADLPANRVRFVPNSIFNGFSSLKFKAWDQTSGVSTTESQQSFGNTMLGDKFSTDFEKASVAVGKSTPRVDQNGNPLFTSILRDTKSPSGDQVKTILGALASDQDQKTNLGIAITGIDNAHGQWQWQSLGKWIDINQVNESKGLLLGPTTKVRFVPNAGFFGDASIQYQLWDQSIGKIGEFASVNNSAFSADHDRAVVNVLTKPVIDISAERKLPNLFSSALVSDLLAGAVRDVIPGTTLGIAITGTTGNGTWRYRIGDGASETIKASPTSAVLLPANASIQFLPGGNFSGPATLSYRAWNVTTLPAIGGSKGNSTGIAFSNETETLSIYVTPPGGNQSPIIGRTTIDLGQLTEDTTSNPGISVKSIVSSTQISDSNSANKLGIAITELDTSHGAWQYSTDGKNWTTILNVSVTNALVLADSAKLRYSPNLNATESSIIHFKAWDGTTGSSGDYLDSTVGNAFSVGTTVTGTVSIKAVNDTPILDATGVHFLPLISASQTSSAIAVTSLVSGASDVETPSGEIGIAITEASGPGTWEFSLNGSTFNPVPSLPALLPQTALLHFVSNSTPGIGKLSYQAWDGSSGNGSSLRKDSVSIAKDVLTIEVGNQPPSLSGPGTLTSLSEDQTSNPGDSISKLIGSTFSDSPVINKGIAVTGFTTSSLGSWEYSLTAGKSWIALTQASNETGLLLSESAKVRFVPNAHAHTNSGTEPTLTYKAWDQTVGISGERVDTTQIGLNAFSSAQTTKITITAAIDPPKIDTVLTQTLDGTGVSTIASLVDGAISSPDSSSFGIAIIGFTGQGKWQVKTTGDFADIGIVSDKDARLLLTTASIRFVPTNGFTGLATLSYKAWDVNSGLSLSANTTDTANKNFFSKEIETLSVFVGNTKPVLTTL